MNKQIESKDLIKLTQHSWDNAPLPVIIGTKSIIRAKEKIIKHPNGSVAVVTEIESLGAMVTTTFVIESVEEIYSMYNSL
jgi:isoprenylcysteine carboxyl methyltransferase (ICMT) family protein YpbQ